jgi:hypothetical protein
VRVCPFPSAWHAAHQRLEDAAARRDCTPPSLPSPLILTGWVITNDVEKMHRWNETVSWAETNGCRNVVDDIPEEQYYFVHRLWAGGISPLGGPYFLPRNWKPRRRPSHEEVDQALQRLIADWRDIVWLELGEITQPLKFTGRKKRRLLVLAVASTSPPWGTWSERSKPHRRMTFTSFRAAINAAIAPHEVDHIEFVTVDHLG